MKKNAKRKWDHAIPSSIVHIVYAICADYDRRACVTESNGYDGAVVQECHRLNTIVDNAMDDVECGIRRHMLNDIIYARGYERSPCACFIAKNTYYARRRKVIHDIAFALNLL